LRILELKYVTNSFQIERKVECTKTDEHMNIKHMYILITKLETLKTTRVKHLANSIL